MIEYVTRKDLKFSIKDNCLCIEDTFQDIDGKEFGYGKRIEVKEPISVSNIDEFLDMVIREISLRQYLVPHNYLRYQE